MMAHGKAGMFRIRKGERRMAFLVLWVFVALNTLMVYKYHDIFTRCGKVGYWSIFFNHFEVSGFDPFTYLTLSKWDVYFVVYRHPLLAGLLYPLSVVNRWLMQLTDMNCAVYIVAVILVCCATYSFLFLFRILHEVIELKKGDAALLTSLFFSFGYILLTVMVPDHFCLSLFLLTMTLYIAGMKMKGGRGMKTWQALALFFLAAGVTLSNGLKVWLAAWFSNGKRFFRPLHLLWAVAVPAALLWGISVYQDVAFVKPMEARGQKILAKHMTKDSIFADRQNERMQKQQEVKGEAMQDKGFLSWTDISTSRTRSAVENLFGESVMLHQDHLLQDIFRSRPVFVTYRSAFNYIVEGILASLFLLGAWMGRRNRFMLLCLSWFSLDMLLHLVMGFGLDEVYIMTAHWAFVIPIALAYLLKSQECKPLLATRALLLLLTLYLVIYNGSLIAGYMLV